MQSVALRLLKYIFLEWKSKNFNKYKNTVYREIQYKKYNSYKELTRSLLAQYKGADFL